MEIEQSKIHEEMHKLEQIIEYTFLNIAFLANAMNRSEVSSPYKKKTFFNEYYALIGDSIITIALSEYLHSKGKTTPGEITEIKKAIESNEKFHNITEKENLYCYAFNKKYFYCDSPLHEKVSYNNHDSFIEAIVAAIYYDNGFEAAKAWINNWLIPRLDID